MRRQERGRPAYVHELRVIFAAVGVEGRNFNELAALRERFLDIAFRDEDMDFNDRLWAAVWSRAIDSGLMLLLEARPETSAAYLQARNASMEEVLLFGFGSIGQAASSKTDELNRRFSFSNDRDQEIEEFRLLRAHLVAAAFEVNP